MRNISYLSIGSNVGDRYQNLKSAIDYFNTNNSVQVISESHFYESEPLYNSEQNNFYNNVIKIKTSLKPVSLLKFCKKIETIMGRVDSIKRNMPRIIDVDIITYNSEIIYTKNLKIPHPCVYERKYVLLPLKEITPKFVFPNNESLDHLLNIIEDSSKIIKLKNNKS